MQDNHIKWTIAEETSAASEEVDATAQQQLGSVTGLKEISRINSCSDDDIHQLINNSITKMQQTAKLIEQQIQLMRQADRDLDNNNELVFSVKITTLAYKNKSWKAAALIFKEGAAIIEKISDIIIAYLSGKADAAERLPILFGDVLTKMTEGYTVLKNDCEAELRR